MTPTQEAGAVEDGPEAANREKVERSVSEGLAQIVKRRSGGRPAT
jgi:hypothetical protein